MASPGMAAGSSPDEDADPNVIVILADDLGYADTSLYDGEIDTPNMARIAQDGVTFTDAYVTSPVCSPSRVGLLSGRDGSRFGADSNFTSRRVLPHLADDDPPGPSMATALQAEGYDTMAIGKWDVSGVNRGDTAEDVRGQPNLPHEIGFDEYYGMLAGHADYCPELDNEIFEYDSADDSYRQRQPSRYVTDEFSDRAADDVQDRADGDDPFFLYLSYNAPHRPYQTPDHCDPATGADAQPVYEEMVRIMDDGIGRVLTALDSADGEMDNADDPNVSNTMVVFLSDNGPVHPWQTGELREGKFTVFDGGVKVPFAMRWPDRLDDGTTYSDMVSAVDLLPTFATAAGASIDDVDYPGIDLVTTVREDDPGHERLAWRYYNDDDAQGGVPRGTARLAIRSDDLKYIREVTPDGAAEEYLFDLARDYDGDGRPDGHTEQVDESGNPEYRDDHGRLSAEHDQWNAHNPVRESFQFRRLPTALPDGWASYDDGCGWTRDETLRCEAAGEAAVLAAGTAFTDVWAASDVHFESDGRAGILLRGADGRGDAHALDGYVATLDSASDQVVLTRVEEGVAAVVAEADHAVETDRTYRLRADVDGDRISVFVDGAPALRWNDADPLPGGSIGLRASEATAVFDDLRAQTKD